MLDDRLRGVKERLLRPVARGLPGFVTPTGVSVVATGVGLASALAAWQGAFGAALALWLACRVLDGLDGTLARVRGAPTGLGGYLDILGDTAVYAAIPLGVAAHLATPDGWAVVAVLLASFYLNAVSWSYLATLLVARHLPAPKGHTPGGAEPSAGARANPEAAPPFTATPMPRGLIEGTETVVLYALALALPRWALPIFGAMAFLTLATALERALRARRLLGPEG
jgi:phosphatidylglycerophosphate synthase